ncbi:MAG: hypothetical protein VX944_01415 [Myxococcota bacterium]|nr:hypothetical protein [Myxococcota bacterium]MEC9388708.1 hypothetical protein [Myxococcota bacterium]
MKQSAVVALMLTACASDYKVIADADAIAGADGFFDTGVTEEEEVEEEPIDPDAPVARCDVTPDKVRPIIETARWIGSESFDPNDEAIVEYSWTLADRPSGSSAVMPSGATPDRSGFETDLAGDYVGQLIVTNESGVQSPPCEVTLTAEPVEALWIEMFWENAGDDMDLHLLAPGGTLKTETDCYYMNCTPTFGDGLDWGVAGESYDNPTLDLDDITLTGPENINIESPEDDTYTVIVHDHTSQTFTAGNPVTVNIRLDGELVWSDTRVIAGEDTYTEFARINVAEGTVDSL